ncbi:MAG: DUF1553 domain-containing protein [Akkermansiaceae bacterium]
MKQSLMTTFLIFASHLLPIFGEDRGDESWWSLQPVVRPDLPTITDPSWARNPIDVFILAELEKAGLKPSAEADEETLARRLHFDLIGLPPEPGAKADVEKLLSSPRFGERWARHWLDVARFGESQGFEYDQLRENAWPYRDWVISAFNEDMPYDRFVRLQIAGDVLEPLNPDAITATGFLVCGAFDDLKPNGDKQRKIMRQDEMEDLVGTVAQSFLGLTVHCARCHDHKFDAITQKEYYQMASALAGVKRGDREVPANGNLEDLQRSLEAVTARLAESDQRITAEILASDQRGEPTGSPAIPISRWTFDTNFRDEIGSAHGIARGGAHVAGGVLHLDGKDDFVMTEPMARELTTKTLEAWVKLDHLNQRGGSAITVQNFDGGRFDAIVFGEREPWRWMAGSNGFTRTKSFGGEKETAAKDRFVHVAITYSEDGTITAYRGGKQYGKAYRTGRSKYLSKNHQVLFGMRHGTKAEAGRMLAGQIDRAQLYDRALTAEEIARSADVRYVTEVELVAALNPAQRKTREDQKAEIVRLKHELSKMKKKQVYAVRPSGSPVTHLLYRGNPFEPREEVSAGGVAAIQATLPADFGLAPNANEAERRKKLAEWMTHPDNPAFARVMMNRLWHYHFGQGLVKTPNDLGFSGGEASHPKLLDWLAAEFREQDWSLKAMHRLMVNSATYRQSSMPDSKAKRVDTDNVLLWRSSPRRLEAEVIRDSILKVAGQLNTTMGGPGFRDFKMHKHKGSWVYDPIDPEGAEFNRRSIYRTWARGSVHPLLAPLDCPDPSSTAPARSVTTTPLGALALMNTSFVLRMSDRFAGRLQREAGDDADAQVTLGFRLAYGRDTRKEEIEPSTAFVKKNGLAAFCRVLFNANEFLYVN